MSIVSGSIPNLINGVSQQPFALRLASQAEEQINGYSSIVEGLTKRPPTKHIARLQAALTGASHLHIINRDASEQYVLVLLDGDLKVYDFAGNEKTVNFPDGKGYLDSDTANFSAVTVADYTFIVNRDKVCAMASETKNTRGPEALVFVRSVNYSQTYVVKINGTNYSYTTTDGTGGLTVSTAGVAAQLLTAINGGGWGATRYGSTLHISHGALSTITTQDPEGDTAMVTIGKTLQNFTDLPKKAVNGFQVEITGASGNAFDNFFVEYDTSSATTNEAGVWREIPKPGRKIAFDATTMPHTLVREADGTFTFKKATWDKCRAGDDKSAPEPSFIGRKINDLFFYRNRLGFIADESVIFSRSGDFFDFWRQTATQLLETDPIDVSVSHVKVSLLRHAVPFNENLLLFSDQTQFILGAEQALTPATVQIDATTEFETSLKAKPVGAGKYVYFCTTLGNATGVQEYYIDGTDRTKDANDVTAHVPKYLKGEVYKLTASTNEDILVALSGTDRNVIYVYKYHVEGNTKAQSSWSKWTFAEGDTVLQADFIESTLWLLVQRTDGIYLERMDIEPGQVAGELSYNVHLDRRVNNTQCTVAYNSGTKKTTITLPYAEPGDLQFVVTEEGGPRPPGFVIDPERPANNQVRVPGDYSSTEFRVGRKYELRYKFSPLVVRSEATGGGQVANTEGRLQLRRMLINYAETGYFRVNVTPFRRETYTYRFTGRVIGSARALLGQPGIETGSYRFPIMANNMGVEIELVNDTPLPCRLLNADWEAQYIVRTKRMT
jgi:hypothetical protein